VKINTEIFIDKHLVKPLVYLLNFLVRIVGKILSINHSLDVPFKRIAISKYKGMGSIIQATPLLQTLRDNYPEAEITFISTSANRAVLERIDCIDRLIILDDSGFLKLLFSFPGFIITLLFKRFDLFLDLEIYSSTSSLITTLSAAKNRVGFYLRDNQYRLGIYTHMLFLNTQTAISRAYLQIALLLHIKNITYGLYPLTAPKGTFESLASKYPTLKINNYIVINPNASDLRLERRWPQKNYIELIRELRSKYPEYPIFLIGNKAEMVYVEKIMTAFESVKDVISFAGKTSFDELIAVINNARFMVTNDTGPLHIAYSVDTPVVGLFGPCSPVQYGMSDKSLSIYNKLYCSPCVHEFEKPPCNGNNQCLISIQLNQVNQAIAHVLNNDFSPLKEHKMSYLSDTGEALGIVHRS
jgi:ADP-heptose:LPS heptosyltransferase